MIETDKRKAIFLLHQEGMGLREICRRLHVSRNSVRRVIRQGGKTPQGVRTDKQQLDPELLRSLHHECQGRIQRMHEKLTEEEGLTVTYSTLTRMLRELEISRPSKSRCDRVPDEPGLEMQHDTSSYRIPLAGHRVGLVASLLYLRYSKRRYLRFYRAFNRFKMKCFLHQALMFWGYSAGQCIIDNTNLARLRGSGKNAVLVPEMAAFAKSYEFLFRCHEIKHSNRKAGEERSFWTVETNFLPGRTFSSLEDLNQQALQWSTVRLENRPQGKAGLIPAKAFEFERAYLNELPAHLPAPYQVHGRDTDQYGFVAFGSNFYWVPGTRRDPIRLLEYAEELKIFRGRECLAQYPLPPDGVKNTPFSPPGQPTSPHRPKNRKKPAHEEEKRLRALSPSVAGYLDFVLQTKTLQRHHYLRKLLALSRKMTPQLFVMSVERACKYRITSLQTLERIAVLELAKDGASLPWAELDEDFRERATYQEGALSEQPDLSIYDPIPEDPDHE